MKVSDILRVKGNTLYTATPDEPLAKAVEVMAGKDIGSLVVMEHGDLVGMLTFREVILAVVKNGGQVGTTSTWNDLSGSPCRSWRIAQAYMRAGTWPRGGISPIS